LGIGIVVRSLSANPSADFVAMFQCAPVGGDVMPARGLHSEQDRLVEHGGNIQNGSVSIYSTELVQNAEGVACPSLVRLHHVDDEVCRLITDTPQEFLTSSGKARPFFPYRKIR